MKLFNKFKQLNREIKLVIITALIASCIGVYAMGECIISATADDVTYNNTTVQAAIDELFSMSESYCPPGYECTKRTLYNIMKKSAVLDNIASTYVTSSSGIDFSQISSDTNGKGVYEIASTANNTYPIYYYRGEVNNNYVKFAGFCWKAVITTDTGGVKLIYNGTINSNGYCNTNSVIANGSFNSNTNSPAYIGYMYGTVYEGTQKKRSELTTSYVFGNDVTYSNGTYTLQDTMTTTGTWSNDYNALNNNHYTCWTTGTSCTYVYYVYYTDRTYGAYYITLKEGKKVSDALDEMFNGNDVNTNSSTIKTTIDNWYNTNLSSYTRNIEDKVYCNDRSISNLGGWEQDGGHTSTSLQFSPYTRKNSKTPTLTCSRNLDKFTVSSSNGNGALTYPIGLITADEAMYAGAGGLFNNETDYYLNNNQLYWILSPNTFSNHPWGHVVEPLGFLSSNNTTYTSGVRPVISLKSTDVVESGDGTQNNPYVIKTS
jgi:hypothetical protein